VYGIDSGDGSILWSRVIGLGWADEVGGQVQPMKLFVVKAVGDIDSPEEQGGGGPQVVLVAQRRAENVRASSLSRAIFYLLTFVWLVPNRYSDFPHRPTHWRRDCAAGEE
jgi:hypothetical protein